MASSGWLQRPYGSRRRHPISTILDHAMVAELFYHARLQSSVDSDVHGAHVGAFVTGHVGVRRQQGRTREAVIAALRALADGAEQEVACHAFSLRGWGDIAPSVFELAAPEAPTAPVASSRRAGLAYRRSSVGPLRLSPGPMPFVSLRGQYAHALLDSWPIGGTSTA